MCIILEVVFYCVSKKRLFLLGLVFFLIMCISGIYSLSDEMSQAESGLSTSAVDIEIEEFNKFDEPFDEDGKNVMPGDEIILKPRVNNLGIECYLRAKITYTIGDEEFDVVNYIKGNYSSWTKDGEYYYYDSVLGREEYVELFNKVEIPGSLTPEYYGKIIVVYIVVEAIQAKNFDGDWTGIEIKESVERTYDIDYGGESSIIYEDDVNNHIDVDDDFFGNLGNIVPGDSISEKVQIKNNSYDKNEYFLNINYDELTDEELDLLRNIKLVIKNSKGSILTSSNLEDKSRHSLGIYTHNGGDEITIELSLPIDIDNDYSKLFTKVVWEFSYDVIEHYGENPKTGDLKFDMSITVFILSAIGFLVVLIVGKVNSDEIEK